MATDQIHSTDAPDIHTSALETLTTHWPTASKSFWHASAPAGVQRRYASGDLIGGWKRWRRHVTDRGSADLARQLAERLAGSRKKAAGAMRWGIAEPVSSEPRLAWLSNLAEAKPRRSRELAIDAPNHIDQWLESTGGEHRWPASANEAFEAVAWARALPALARISSGESWWQVVERLHGLALDAAAHRSPTADPLAHQLACGELPWTLAALFPEIEPCRQLASGAAKAISSGISELLDGSGVPHSRHLSVFHRLVASWTRCRLLAAANGFKSKKTRPDDSSADERQATSVWDDDAEQQFFQAVSEALRLTRADGAPVLSETAMPGDSKSSSKENGWLTDIAAGVADERNKRFRRSVDAIAAVRGAKRSRAAKPKSSAKHLPDASRHSEWAELAMLQNNWSPCAERLAIAYSGRGVRIELQADRRLLLHGVWEMEIAADGRTLEPQGNWSQTCWASDADCDYLELEMQLSHGISVQRQIVLSRKEKFLFLADAALGEIPRELKYRGWLPLARGIEVQPANETRELVLLAKGKPRAVVLPLELPEWRIDPRGGSLLVGEPPAGEHPNAVRNRPALETTVTNGSATKRPLSNGSPTNGSATNRAAHESTPSNNAERSAVTSHGAVATEAAADRPAAIALSQSIHGARLFAPLWIDLSVKRARKLDRDPLTWRQLTVAEQRHILPRDVAVGYRMQCGPRQWVAYRSLAAPANRTFLGINLSTEFYVGQFDTDGETESIIEIE